MSPYLLAALLACHTAPAPPGLTAPDRFAWPPHDLAALTDAEARQLAGRRALYVVWIDSEPDGDPETGWRYECPGDGPAYRSLWLRDGDDLAAEVAMKRGDVLLVEGTLRRIAHAPVKGADGSRLPALVEYRLTAARVLAPKER
jgi:hypothetical protein